MGNERKAVGKMVGRMYKHHERTTGHTPSAKEVRTMEKLSQESGRRVDQQRKERNR